MELNKKIKRNQLLVVKENFGYNSGCAGRITIKKGLIVKSEDEVTPKHKNTDITVYTGRTFRTVEAENLRVLIGKEKFYAKDRFETAENSEEESYVD